MSDEIKNSRKIEISAIVDVVKHVMEISSPLEYETYMSGFGTACELIMGSRGDSLTETIHRAVTGEGRQSMIYAIAPTCGGDLEIAEDGLDYFVDSIIRGVVDLKSIVDDFVIREPYSTLQATADLMVEVTLEKSFRESSPDYHMLEALQKIRDRGLLLDADHNLEVCAATVAVERLMSRLPRWKKNRS